MTPDQYQQLSEHFAALCDLPSAEQAAGLRAVHDEIVREELRAMLAADTSEVSFLDDQPTGLGGAALGRALLTDAPDPQEIGHYKIIRRIGAGGMGVVYEAEEAKPRRRVALKVLHPWLRTPDVNERFRFEAQALANVDHPGIPKIYQTGEIDGVVYLAMELVRGRSLLDYVALAALDVRGRLRLVAAIAEAVSSAHHVGLIHRDLKPENLMVLADGTPKILDFGISIAADDADAPSGPSARAGTRAYMSPEQRAGDRLDTRSDVYALGLLLAELLGGSSDPRTSSISGAPDDRPRPPPIPPSLTFDVRRIVERAIADDPDVRTPSAAALADDLRRAAADQPLSWGRGGFAYRSRLWLRRNKRLTAVLAGISLVAIAFLGGWATLDAQRVASRERAAGERLEVSEARAAEALAKGEPAEATREIRDFASLGEHRETRAAARAWENHAKRLLLDDPFAASEASSRALVAARHPDDARAALLLLAQALAKSGRWAALHKTLVALGPQGRAGLGQTLPVLVAACGDYDLLDPSLVTEEDHRLLSVLRRATPAPPGAARLVDLDDGEPARLVTIDEDALSLWRWDGALTLQTTLPPPRDLGLGSKGLGVVGGAGTLFVGGSTLREATPPGGARVARADLEAGRWSPLADLPSTHLTTLSFTELGTAGPTLFVTTDFPNWGFHAVPIEGGPPRIAEPVTHALGATTGGFAYVDLDGDGRDEILLGQAGWRFGYQVRALAVEPDGALSTLSGAVVGAVHAVAADRTSEGAVRIVASVGHGMPSRALGSDQNGPPGLAVFHWTGDALEQVEERRLSPITLPSGAPAPPGRLWVADLDGDGIAEWIVSLPDATWILRDPLGESADFILGGLIPLAVADLDGDGTAELLVSRGPEGPAWVLGIGDSSPPISSTDTLSRVDPGEGPQGDAIAAQTWDQARQLADLGLVAEAATELADLAPRQRSEARAAFHRAAAMWFDAIDDPRALEQLAIAFSLHRDDPDIARPLVHRAALDLDLPLARDAASTLPAEERPIWNEGALARAPLVFPVTGPPDPRWRLGTPGGLSVEPDGSWRLLADTGRGVIMETTIALDGDGFALSVDLDVARAEYHGLLIVEVIEPDTEATVARGLAFTHGGGGFTALTASCPTDSWAVTTPGSPTAPKGRLAFRVAHRLDATTCAPRFDLESGPRVSEASLPAAGVYTLRIRTFEGDGSVRRIDATLRDLRLWGARWIDTPALSATDEARRRVAAGRSSEALALVPPEDPAHFWALLRLGSSDDLDESVRNRIERDDLALLRLALRSEPDTIAPVLARLLKEEYPSFFGKTFGVAIQYHADEPDVARALIDPTLDRGRLIGPDAVRLGVLRAERLVDIGQFGRGRREAERVLRDIDPNDPAQASARYHALITSARVSQALDTPDLDALLARAARAAPSPEVHVFYMKRYFSTN
ncbi:MAG: hypothetical protein EA397_00755 [Deltaproteobacteria bacterium]|nr:MAG: hypothetical protein EA397_00755 [Deltaproteobacteria bacterium]